MLASEPARSELGLDPALLGLASEPACSDLGLEPLLSVIRMLAALVAALPVQS